MTAREQAEALRLGLISGYVTLPEVVAWADRVIEEDRGPALPVLYDLSLLPPAGISEAVSLLGAMPGECSHEEVGRCIARLIYQRLRAGDISTERAARALYTALIEGYAPDREFEAMAYTADDGVDLALEGTYGTLEDVRADMLEYLQRYAPAPE